MKLRPSMALIILVLLGCASVSNSGYGLGFADLSIHPDWVKVDGEMTSAILSEYSDKILVAESFRYKETESVIVRAFPAFSVVTVNNDRQYCVSEAQDIIIPKYDFVSGKAHGEVYRYPSVVILYSLHNKNQKCPESLEATGYFYSLNARAESVARLLPHISEKAIREFCRIDARERPFSIGLISFDKKSLPSADAYLKDTGSLEFDVGGTAYRLSFSLDVGGPFTMNSCRETRKE